MKNRRVGILGGTFDPVHNGHLAIAEHVRSAIELEQVLLAPARDPWMKQGRVRGSAEDRLAMIELAVAGRPGLRASRVDLDRPGPTYTIDTIRDLNRRLGPDVALYLIVGADTLEEMADWREPERIFEGCTVVAVMRRGYPAPERLPASHPGRNALFVDGPVVDVSATEIRRRVGSGESIEGMVPPAVERFIRERGLYRGGRAEEQARGRGGREEPGKELET
ncbi:MAG: nicotinate-nucleotide adenylyltransferase [Gemmatimonadetes bacterium]|nr:nicotinate-nucleotide adenylyltransferase [Gemmatimonadota bacterium]